MIDPGHPRLSIVRQCELASTDNCLTAIVHMDVLDADKLVPSVTQASKYLNLRSKCPHQTSGLPLRYKPGETNRGSSPPWTAG